MSSEDSVLINTLADLNREKKPERIVFAKGTGAFGIYTNYYSQSKYTSADLFQGVNRQTPIFVRFSMMRGFSGSADTQRDVRGFSIKFYTNEGNLDIVGSSLPVFYINDAIKFASLVHALQPSDKNNLYDVNRYWRFMSNNPETTNMVVQLFSDKGVVNDYRHIDGFGVSTYLWINKEGKRFYIKYRFKSMQGMREICDEKATLYAGCNPSIAGEILYESIKNKEFPTYELQVQIMDVNNTDKYEFNPLDDTKTWTTDLFPWHPIGLITLNRNPKIYFKQVEQAAFNPANYVPGTGLSPDKLLQGRSFAYSDSQRYRIGQDYNRIPVNCKYSPNIKNNFHSKNKVRYIRESQDDNTYSFDEKRNENYNKDYCSFYAKGLIETNTICKVNEFGQAGEFYRNLNVGQKIRLITRIGKSLYLCNNKIIEKQLINFKNADRELEFKLYSKINELKRIKDWKCTNGE